MLKKIQLLYFTHSERGVEDMVEVNGEEIKEPLTTGRGHSVTGVVHVCPSISALG